jgi:hypothetical protein
MNKREPGEEWQGPERQLCDGVRLDALEKVEVELGREQRPRVRVLPAEVELLEAGLRDGLFSNQKSQFW